jgi:hypothetical protein
MNHGDYLDETPVPEAQPLKGLDLRASRMDRSGKLPRDPDIMFGKVDAHEKLLKQIQILDETITGLSDVGVESSYVPIEDWETLPDSVREQAGAGLRQHIRDLRAQYYNLCTLWHFVDPNLREKGVKMPR